MSGNVNFQRRRDEAVSNGIATAFPVSIARALNSEVWDVEGRRYIDFAGGIAVLNTGHRHPKVIEAVRAQLDLFTHTAFQVVGYEGYVAVCERLNALAPFSGPAKSVLFTTGAEAVENAVKIARAGTGRTGLIAFSGGFHGRTSLAMGLTGKVVPYKRNFGISPPGIFHLPFPASSLDTTVEDSLRALQVLFRADIDPSQVAAFIVEPILGEGGFLELPAELLRALRALCDEHGIVLIADEVQSGFARTGKMFAIEHSGVQPDLVAVAKSLAGGFPLSGVIGRRDLMDSVDPGGLGGTYAGSPIACAAALAVLDVIEEEGLVERADVIGAQLKGAIENASQQNDAVGISSVRGRGAMIAFDIVKHRGTTSVPDLNSTKAVIRAALSAGLILLSCGVHGNTIRLLNPLTISDELLKEGLQLLVHALTAGEA